MLASAGRDDTVVFWETGTGKLLRRVRLQNNRFGVTRLDFSPDGRQLLTKGTDGIVHLWNPTTGEELQQFPSTGNISWSYAFAPDGKTLITGHDSHVSLWDAKTGEEMRRFGPCPGVVWAVAFAPDGRTIAASADRGLLLGRGHRPRALPHGERGPARRRPV